MQTNNIDLELCYKLSGVPLDYEIIYILSILCNTHSTNQIDNINLTNNNTTNNNSTIDYSTIDNPTIDNSTIDNLTIDNSTIDNSTIDNSTIDNLTIDNSTNQIDYNNLTNQIDNNNNILYKNKYYIIYNFLHDNNYSLYVLIKEIFNYIIDNNYHNNRYFNPLIISKLAKLENMILKNTNDDIYISGLINIFI